LQAVASELGERYIPYQADVSDRHSIQDVCEKIAKEHPTIDILINNAGMWHQ
jgi:NADP-dependent 3-hydroxy acid dehydrogenase YdfG